VVVKYKVLGADCSSWLVRGGGGRFKKGEGNFKRMVSGGRRCGAREGGGKGK